MCCIQETHLTCRDTHRLKIKGWRKIYQANGEQKKKAGVAILVSDKIDFKATKIKRDKEGHYIMVKGSIQQEELTILTSRYIRPIKRLRLPRLPHNNSGRLQISILDRSTKQKINKDIQDLNSDPQK